MFVAVIMSVISGWLSVLLPVVIMVVLIVRKGVAGCSARDIILYKWYYYVNEYSFLSCFLSALFRQHNRIHGHAIHSYCSYLLFIRVDERVDPLLNRRKKKLQNPKQDSRHNNFSTDVLGANEAVHSLRTEVPPSRPERCSVPQWIYRN
jgi:hypothetical protein